MHLLPLLKLRRSGVALAAVVLVSALAAPERLSAQVQVREVIWGFDGTVRAHRFNPLSAQIDNPTADIVEVTFHLVKAVGGRVVDAPLVTSVPVSPYAQRWVQFYPFVKRDWETWTLVWDDGRERYELPKVPLRGFADADFPTTVLLADTQDVSQSGGAAKRFPDALFPPVVTATDGLDAVLLDHVPHWTEPQREAFLDWLARGGTVHLLFGADGEFPQFPQSLAPLNTPAERFHVGAGIVFRHRLTRADVSRDLLEDVLVRETASRIRLPKSELDEIEEMLGRPNLYTAADQLWFDDFTAGVFHDLRSKTVPKHQWPLIYLLSIVYVVWLFPCCYLLGRRRLSYPVVYGILLGVIGLFSLALGLIGRRGHGESTALHTIAIARNVSGNEWDVTGWSNAFVTQGGFYRIEHAGSGRLYSTSQEAEPVSGAIHSGQDGYFFEVDLPPYSSRTFAHRVKTAKPDLQFTAEEWEAEQGRLRKLVVAVNGSLGDESLVSAFAVYGRNIYRMRFAEGRLVADSGAMPVGDFLQALDREDFWHYVYPDIWVEEIPTEDLFVGKKPTEQELHARMAIPLIAQSLDLDNLRKAERFRLPPDRVRLFVYAPLPQEFFVQNDNLGRQAGSVLYSVDLLSAPAGADMEADLEK